MKRTLLAAAIAVLGIASAQNPAVLINDVTSPVTQDSKDSRAIRPADIDGDGDIDLFVANFGQTNLVYRNLGGGNFEIIPPFSLSILPDDSFDGAWGDMDADGDLDLAVANGSKNLMPGGGVGKDNELWTNQGPKPGTEGRFDPVTTGPVVSDKGETYAVEWADIDGDGDLDLLFANRLQANLAYFNDGAGQFSKMAADDPFVADLGTSRDLAVGDIDEDGDVDVVVANSDDEPCFVYLDQGGAQGGTEGAFARLRTGPVALDIGEAYGVKLVDYDADGHLDLYVTRRFGQNNILYRNLGNADFERRLDLAPSQDHADSYASAWGDVDADGDLDCFVANRNEETGHFANNGDGTFTCVTWGEVCATVGDSRDVVVADIDADGMPDVLVANSLGGDDFFFRNLGCSFQDLGFEYHPASAKPELAGCGWLAPASTVQYELAAGPADRPAVLVVGLTTAFLPFKGGTLVPSPDLLVVGLVTDSDGALAFDTLVPAGLPAGLTVFHQAWIQDPASPTGVDASNALSVCMP